MGACISQDELDKSVGKFGTRKNSTGANDVPSLYCGFIYPAEQKLTGPASGIDCVYYEAKATTRSSSSNLDQKSMTKYHTLEVKQVDFIISDCPNNPLSSWLYVPASFFAMKVNGAKQYQMKTGAESSSVHPDNVEKMMQNVSEDPHSLTFSLNNKQLVFADEVLEVGQQVAILGIIKEITLFSGETARVLTPVASVNMTDAFYRQNNWSATDKERFNEITGNTPTFLISGKNQHFAGVNSPKPINTTSPSKLPKFPSLEEVRTNYRARYLPFYADPMGDTHAHPSSNSGFGGNANNGVGLLPERATSDGDFDNEAPGVLNNFPHHNVHSHAHAINQRHGVNNHHHGTTAGGGGFVGQNRFNNNHHSNNHAGTATNSSSLSHTDHHNALVADSTDGSCRTVDLKFKPLPREHEENQQDFEDTVRTRQ